LQCVAVRCSVSTIHCRPDCRSRLGHICTGVLQGYPAVCCSVLQRVAACRSMLQRLQCVFNTLSTWMQIAIGSRLYCSAMLQCVVLCCSVLQCIAVRCSALQCVAACLRYTVDLIADRDWVTLLQVCCSAMMQCVAFCYVAVCCRVLQCVAVCYSVLQCVAVCCSVLQCVYDTLSTWSPIAIESC